MEDKEINNLIIKPSDSRFKYLDMLFSNYNESNYSDGSGVNSIWYYIPKELVLAEYFGRGTIVKFNPGNKDLDWDNWVNNKVFSRILWDTCHLTIQEYYDLIIGHINDITLRPKCDYCNKFIRFYNMSSGYSKSSSGHNFCCSYHRDKYIREHLDEFPMIIESTYTNLLGLGNIPHISTEICRIYKTYLGFGDWNDECYFYIATEDGYLKFGVTNDINGRSKAYDNFKIIFTSTRVIVSSLEALIKVYLGKSSEWIEFKSLVQSFRTAYLDSIKFISTINDNQELIEKVINMIYSTNYDE